MSEAGSSNNGVYFLSLELENVRCFGKKQKLDLSDGKGNPARWTVILGNNGSGKTTLLELLEKYNLLHYDSEASSFPRNDSNKPELEYCFAFGNILKTIESSTPIKRTIVLDYSGNYLPISAESFFRDRKFIIYTYGATRKLNENKTMTHTGKLLYEQGVRENYDELINAEEWLREVDYIASKSSEIQNDYKKRFEIIKDVLINLLPDVKDIRISIPNENSPLPKVEFKTLDGWLFLYQLSLGYQTMIAWMVDLAAHLFNRYPESPNPIKEPAVVLIDEIDLHLHPRWQREIMRYLSERFTNTQFIVTAHSPLIVQAAEDENANIVVLRREGDEVIIDQQPKAIHGWRVDQLLASDLFGLEGSRSPKSEERLKERDEILSKPYLSEADKNRLEELKYIPMAESPEDIEAMSIIREAAQLLKDKYKQ
jgi:predicted ATP-binding protein involved in virulence